MVVVTWVTKHEDIGQRSSSGGLTEDIFGVRSLRRCRSSRGAGDNAGAAAPVASYMRRMTLEAGRSYPSS